MEPSFAGAAPEHRADCRTRRTAMVMRASRCAETPPGAGWRFTLSSRNSPPPAVAGGPAMR